jgi:hypothetical protein
MTGKKVPEPRIPAILKERSIILYALYIAVTFGVFGAYWLYTLIDDPNRHFKEQAAVEEAMFDVLRGY